ncbi:MAG TPA: AAA family ATPase [Anaeromyxobacteraceae bacterium]|nr:AAA family ATPase [Anaeromyxobacteraceae bacterium]
MDREPVLLVGLRPEVQNLLTASLAAETECQGLPRVPAEGDASQRKPAVAALSLEQEAPAVLRYMARLVASGTKVVALGPKDADLILQAMRAGASEFVLASDAAEIAKAVRAQLQPIIVSHLGSVVTVFAAKGGVGSTTIAVNLAGNLQRRGQRVCVLDLDVNLGDVLAFLDLVGSYSMSDVAANLHRLDRDLLDSSLPRHRSGIHVLAQSGNLEEADRVDGPVISDILEFLRHQYDWVVVDGARSFDPLPLAALDVSEHVLLALTQEIPAVRNAHRCVEIFRRLGYADGRVQEGLARDGRVQLVVNRHQEHARIPDDAIAETTGLPIAASVANDFSAASEAIHRGALLADVAPRSPATRDIERMTRLLGVEEPAGAEQPAGAESKSLLKRLFMPRAVAHGT